MAYIIAIDDEQAILDIIQKSLRKEGYQVDTFTSPSQVNVYDLQKADLLLLDVMMPDEDGFSFCAKVRSKIDCPILFLTAKSQESDLIHGLGLGADDYIYKPFTIGALRARVAAHLRREGRKGSHYIKYNNLLFDLDAKSATVDNNTIPFTKSEYSICLYLLEHTGQVFSKEQIYEAVFGFDGVGDDSAITEHIKNIRAKIRPYGLEPIDTVWGLGYKWKKSL